MHEEKRAAFAVAEAKRESSGPFTASLAPVVSREMPAGEAPARDDIDLSLPQAVRYIAAQVGRSAMISCSYWDPDVGSMPDNGWAGLFGPLELGPQRLNKKHHVRFVRLDHEPREAPQTDRLWMGHDLALVFDRSVLRRVYVSGKNRAVMFFEFENGFFDIDLRYGDDANATFLT